MINLPNKCRCSELTVYPKNWKTSKASTKIKWFIAFRFYDPNYLSEYPKGKQVHIKGMNSTTVLSERRKITQNIYDELMRMLTLEGYNPITRDAIQMIEELDEITTVSQHTPFVKALQFALSKRRISQKVFIDENSILKYTTLAATALNYANVPIYNISILHITQILEQLWKTNPNFSNYRYNKYVKCYISFYKILIPYGAVTGNIPKSIERLVETKRIRETLTNEERKTVSDYLFSNNRPFWNFVQIFFHSGGRESELVRLKGSDVNLSTQRYKCIIQKGKQKREAYRTIKNVALPFWKEQMKNCGKNDFVFSKNLLPGPTQIDPSQISRRWKRHVKDKIGITADLYSLKHSNASETVDLLSDEDAAAQMGHTSTAMLKSTYDVKRHDRQHERLKKLDNRF